MVRCDPDATPEQLWAHTRGDWYLDAERIAGERSAALNYQERGVLVAELNDPGHELLAGNTGRPKKALIGRVLAAGHSIHEAVIGRQVEYPPGNRNSIRYSHDPEAADAADPDLPEPWDQPGARGQCLQMDAAVRRAIEDAAQDA